MANKLLLFASLAILLVLVISCAQTAETQEEAERKPSDVDLVSETSRTEDTGTEESVEAAEGDESEKEIPAELIELLGTAGKKVQGLSYSYKGPETNNFLYEFYVKGDNVKYILNPSYKTVDVDEDAYDAVYLDKKLKTAQAYCDSKKCIAKGKKADLDYNEANIMTPLDWLESIESAEKSGEEQIESRNTWIVATNNGKIWIESFYGVPLKAEFENSVYEFKKMGFNTVKDEDVVPKG
ncbi:hypothetical protein KY347_03755 [Candidatus Woesearchaeota archaeon]|nr:hypothetical protein [Candidatus Woesearchaeota archaeon]